jgi:SAM-dependent methyltransferase
LAVDEVEFREFFADQYARLCWLGLLLTGDRAEAEELAQEALARTWWRWVVRRPNNPAAYARRVLVNRRRSLLRRAGVEARFLARARPEPVPPAGDEQAMVLWQAVQALPPRQRAVLVLRFHGDEVEHQAAISLTTGLEDPGHAAGRHTGPARRRPMIRGGIMDMVTVKQRQQAAWASGDYAAVGARLLLTAELLCEAVDLRAGERVLDVACGNGNAALAAARRFCQVVGVDYVPALLERARRRAEAEGLEATFQEGDAEALPFSDASFDVVLSTCGAMFAPDQEQTASELLRVCRPGGRIGMVNWTPDSYVGELFRAIGRHLPPPPGVRPPVLWGSQERLHELFGPGVSISAPRRSFLWRFPSAEHQVEFFATFYGPTVKTLAAVGDRAAALRADMLEAAWRFDVSEDGDTLVLRMDYLEAVIHKPAP